MQSTYASQQPAFRGGGSSGFTPATLPVAATGRWGSNFSSVTLSGSEVVSASDYTGNGATLTPSFAGTGAIEMTDNRIGSPTYGLKFWRFNRNQAMRFLAGAYTTTNMAVFMVMRQHTSVNGISFFSIGPSSADGTTVNTNTATLQASVSSGLAPYLKNANIVTTSDANKQDFIVGMQWQVIGANSGSGASSTRIYMNSKVATTSGPTNASATGGVIGAYAHTITAANIASTGAPSGAAIDVFEVVTFNAKLSNANADAVSAALMSSYSIVDSVNSLVLEGDSQTASFYPSNLPGNGPVNTMRIPAGWRVINSGVSGDGTQQLTTRRDATNSVHQTASMLPGENRLIVMVGVNDLGARTPLETYNQAPYSIVNLIGDAVNGYAARGYDKIYQAINISPANAALSAGILTLRTYLRNTTQFATDTGTTYGGNLEIIELPAVTSALLGTTVFDTASDALNYQLAAHPVDGTWNNDGLHPSTVNTSGRTGMRFMIQGGFDTDGGSGVGYESAFL